jgi:hypothetical protein
MMELQDFLTKTDWGELLMYNRKDKLWYNKKVKRKIKKIIYILKEYGNRKSVL